ncbi:MAG: hypothetical protein ACE5I7_01950 [Candidatus Binatia bacterium]
MDKVRIGSRVDSWCTRCKLLLAHTVEAMAGNKVTRVHCNTCQAQHAYRPNPPGQRRAASGTRTARTGRSTRTAMRATPTPQASDYATLILGRDASAARSYKFAERFAPSELINHPTFGLGLVTATKDGAKIEVLFPDGLKTLVHDR